MFNRNKSFTMKYNEAYFYSLFLSTCFNKPTTNAIKTTVFKTFTAISFFYFLRLAITTPENNITWKQISFFIFNRCMIFATIIFPLNYCLKNSDRVFQISEVFIFWEVFFEKYHIRKKYLQERKKGFIKCLHGRKQ